MDRKKYFISIMLFLCLFALSVPFHIDSTSKIVNKQNEIDNVEGFFIRDSRNERFQSRQYIRIEDSNKIQIMEHEENIYEELD